MGSFLVLGTDTDVGKTAFSLLWLSAFGDRCAYWKPVETGPSDTACIRTLVPAARVFPPVCSLPEPLAPPLAARRAGVMIPPLSEILARRPLPADRCFLLIESFGSPWSPLDEEHLQIELIRRLRLPCVLVSSTKLGAIGRTLQCLIALEQAGIDTRAVALLGADDPFARQQLSHHQARPIIALSPPDHWTPEGLQRAATAQRAALDEMAELLAADDRLPPSAAASAAGIRPVPSILERDRASVWHPYTPLSAASPIVCVGAEDEFLVLEDGSRLVDGIASWWTILHGHRDPDLVTALHAASRLVDHVLFAGVTHPWGVDLAELLLTSAGMKGGRAFYSDNGSTAVEVALKMAYQFWCLGGQAQRTRFVGFQHGYHGDTFGAMAVSRDPVFFGRFQPLLFQADILPLDATALDEHLRQVAHSTAAIIVEPLVQGAGGMRMHAPQTLADLHDVARQHDVLFIADEVMTGGGRTGTLWAFNQAGIAPDLICAAKTLAGGMFPLAATLVHPRIVAPFLSAPPKDAFFHGHSFTGHPLACAVALASWNKLLTAGLNNARNIEAFWRRNLSGWRHRPGVTDVRIRGTIAAIEVQVSGGYLAEQGQRMARAAREAGVFLRPLGDVLYALPPLGLAQSSLERIVHAMDAALRAVTE